MDFTECYRDTVSSVAAAARAGCRKRVRRLIKRGCSVDCRDNRGWNALHEAAAAEGHQACVDLLVDHGADPNRTCSQGWPQFPIHAAAEFGHIGILRKLIAVTDRVCDRGDGMVSPLYVTIHNSQIKSVELLLSEGYSPDAQNCTHNFGLRSPLALALCQMSNKPYSEIVRLLVAAGASLTEEDWMDLHFAACWLPLLLKAGLDPSLLLQPHMLEQADNEVLNYLLQFVNWSTLSAPLKHILNERRVEKTWEPSPYLDSIPCLAHICRLQVRAVLGPDLLMTTNIVHQLPVPPPLHGFLQFRDIPEASYSHSPPSPLSNRIEEYYSTHQHRHVL
uniref:Ankyrin repeat and SOCS box containing 3 n=1 Tax=Seriola dumerili TaxID=41447 RepID=A0A3B4TGP1_SERDU